MPPLVLRLYIFWFMRKVSGSGEVTCHLSLERPWVLEKQILASYPGAGYLRRGIDPSAAGET